MTVGGNTLQDLLSAVCIGEPYELKVQYPLVMSQPRATPLVYEFSLMVFAIHKAIRLKKTLGYRGVKLVRILIIDQAIYFIL